MLLLIFVVTFVFCCGDTSSSDRPTRSSFASTLTAPPPRRPAGSQDGNWKNSAVRREEDQLNPDPHLEKLKTKSHRHIRSCFEKDHGSLPYETHPINQDSELQTFRFEKDVVRNSWQSTTVQGHITRVGNALKRMSVVEPGVRRTNWQGNSTLMLNGGTSSAKTKKEAVGCAAESLSLVKATADVADCVVATNAGFFDTHTGSCKGDVVSDGRHVHPGDGVQNVHFGLTKDGNIFTGYLSENVSHGFEQLVGGVVWLVRKGKPFVQESKKIECEDTQETGSLDRFIDVVSARTAVGHDRQGRVVLAQVDGHTDKKDSDPWASVSWSCDRSVSTVICIHEADCAKNCSGNGKCLKGNCQCDSFWHGEDCSRLWCSSEMEDDDCSGHGTCDVIQGCICELGWRGAYCSLGCNPGTYGPSCHSNCTCEDVNTEDACDQWTGECICSPGYRGLRCHEKCPYGFYGASCILPCSCGDECPCHHVTGECIWTPTVMRRDILGSKDAIQNRSSMTGYYLDLNAAANCKLRATVQLLNLVVDQPQEYDFWLKTLIAVSLVGAISIILNISLISWNLYTKKNHFEDVKEPPSLLFSSSVGRQKNNFGNKIKNRWAELKRKKMFQNRVQRKNPHHQLIHHKLISESSAEEESSSEDRTASQQI